MTLKNTDKLPLPSPAPPTELTALWDMESADYECDCPGPPPEFRLPPPPRPPFLQEVADCSELPLPDLETCDAVPVIDAEYHSSPVIPSITVIVVCSVLLLAMVLIASVLVWKHKRKMQNFLPCKTSPQNRCDVSNGNGVIYEDLTNIRPRTLPNHCAVPGQTAPSIEMIDVKSASNYNSGYPVLGNPSVFICPAPRPDPYNSQDLYNPVYEELSNVTDVTVSGSGDRGESDPESEGIIQAPVSEDEFAEDELSLGETQLPPGAGSGGSGGGVSQQLNSGTSSLQGSTGNDLCRDLDSSDADDRSRFLVAGTRNFSLPPGYRSRTSRAPHQHRSATTTDQRRPRSLDRRRGWRNKAGGGSQQPQTSPQPQVSPSHRQQDCGEFHEGLLLDALLQLYPTVMNSAGARTGGSRSHHHPVVPSVAHRLPYLLQQPPPPPAPAPPPTTASHRGNNHVVNPYESVPVLNHLHQQQQQHHGYTGARELFSTFRRGGGKSQSQDSSFGSDSGYSNNTSSRGRETSHRLSAHSGDLVIS